MSQGPTSFLDWIGSMDGERGRSWFFEAGECVVIAVSGERRLLAWLYDFSIRV